MSRFCTDPQMMPEASYMIILLGAIYVSYIMLLAEAIDAGGIAAL